MPSEKVNIVRPDDYHDWYDDFQDDMTRKPVSPGALRGKIR